MVPVVTELHAVTSVAAPRGSANVRERVTKGALLVAAALAFGLMPVALRMAPTTGALVLVLLAVGLAVAASGSVQSVTLAAGAVGAFAAATLASSSAAAAGAALVGFAYAERTFRVRTPAARAAHVASALAAGAAAGALTASYADDAYVIRGVAVVVAAVLASLPLLVDADDLIAHLLDGIALTLRDPSPSRSALREGAELRRSVDDTLLDRDTARGVRTTWAALVRLAEARQRLERTRSAPTHPVIALVDDRIRDHVAALARAYSAVDAARAARIGLDDAALRNVTSTGQSFEAESLALVDVSQEPATGSARDPRDGTSA